MKRHVCVNIFNWLDKTNEEVLDAIKKANFDGVAFSYDRNLDVENLINEIKKRDLFVDYVHAPFNRADKMWEDCKETIDVLNELKECIDICYKYNIDRIVVHPFIGFNKEDANYIGINNFKEILEYAKNKNIKIAFENVEGESYLALIAKELFPTCENAYFCYDSGHELCYNKGKDQLKMYGNKLLITHLNDNLGVSNENIWWTDDLHYLLGDGILDINNLIKRLKDCNYQGNLSFELKISHPFDTKTYEKYRNWGLYKYFEELYKIAEKIDKLLD